MNHDLKTVVSRKDYDVFAGPDWPSYKRLLAGDRGTTAFIQQEIQDFIGMMHQTYQQQTQTGEILAQANQQRQQQKFFDKQYHGASCRVPWETVGINARGDVFICLSPSWIPKFVGNILECDNIYQALNSDMALSIRQEILSGRYTYCNHRLCSFFGGISPDSYQTQGVEITPEPMTVAPELLVNQIPKNIILDFDYTCNFVCPSCRTELINHNNHHVFAPINDRISQQIKKLIVDQIQQESVTVRWCGGEPFISRVYVDLMEYMINHRPNNIRHTIQTNGSYLKKKSNLVSKLLPTMQEIRVSFDAASADTYHKIRVNGQWDQLLDNVRWLRQCINEVAPDCELTADFVVQLANYKEIPAFVELCRTLDIDRINWQKMWNWDTWSQEKFSHNNIYRTDHPLYAELVKMFGTAGQSMSQI
jgi:organic radical activating enzyme